MKKNTIDILGVPYTVHWKTEQEMPDTIGEAKYNHHEIWLNEEYKSDLERINQVLLHEIIHCISCELNLNLKENQVNNLAVGLFPLIKKLKP